MTPVSASQRAQPRLAPLASLDCSITDSRLSIVDTPSLNSYFECDQLSDMVDDSLFEITNTGCLSSSVFRRPDREPEPLQQQQQLPSFLYSSYDYSASSRIPIAAQPSARYRTSTRHNNQHHYNTNITATQHPVTKLAPHPIATAPVAPKTHSKLIKTETSQTGGADKTGATKQHSHSPAAGGGRSKKSAKKSRLGLGSFLGGLFESSNSKEVNKDKDTRFSKSSQLNGAGEWPASNTPTPQTSSIKSRDSIRTTNERRLHKKSANHALPTSISCNDFGTTCSGLKAGGSEVLLLDQPRTLQRPISATQLSHTTSQQHTPTTASQVPDKHGTVSHHQKCIPTHSSEQPVAQQRPAKSVKFSLMDQVFTRPASSNPRPVPMEGVQPASIIKRTSAVAKSSTCSQTESSSNLSQLLAKYDKNSALIRELSEKLQLTDTIASPCSVLDTVQANEEEEEAEAEAEADEPGLHAISDFYKSDDLNLRAGSASANGNQLQQEDQLNNNNNKQRAFI